MSAVSLQEAKAWLRIDTGYTSDDVQIQALIDGAEAWVEKYTDHVLTARTVTFEQGCHEVYSYPLTINTNASTQPYKVDKRSLKSIISVGNSGSVSVTVGYATASAVPAILKTAVLKLVTYSYENRDIYGSELPFDVQILLNQFRRSVAFA